MIKLFGGKQDENETPEPQENLGLFARMKQAVSRTRESLSSKIEGIAALTRVIDENDLEELELV